MKMFTLVKYLFRLCLTCCLFGYSRAVTWNQLMDGAMWGTGEVSDLLRPYILENFPTGNVSGQCMSSLIQYAEGMKNFEPWAVKMFDATGKPPSSLLRGTYSDFGSFDECISLEVDTFRGRFCMLSLTTPLFPPIKFGRAEKESYIKTHGNPPKWAKETTQFWDYDWAHFFGLYLGICIPSTCSERDLTNIISAYTKPAELQMSLSDCQVKEQRQWASSEKIAIFATTCLIIIIITGTTLDFFERRIKQNNNSLCKEGINQKILKSFSVIYNMEILLKKNKSGGSLDFLNGMKFYTVIWVLILHLFAIETLWEFKRHRNLHHFIRLRNPATIIFENSLTNSSYFIFLNGFLSTYSFKMKQAQAAQHTGKRNNKNNGPLKIIFIKYLRLMPSVIFLMLMTFVIPLAYNGPIWNSTWSNVQNVCLKHGWTNILLVSNFLSYYNHCWIHMWLYSTLIQFQIIGLSLVYIAKRHPKFALTLGSLFVIVCGVRDVIVSIQYEFGFPTIPAMKSMINFKEFLSQIYCCPYNHFGTFGMGMLFGWINLKDFKMSKLFLAIGWAFYVLLSLALFYIVFHPTQNLTVIAFHNAFRGIFFGLQMGWLVFVCLNGTAGIFGKIFSWKALLPFSKLLNSVIMFHPLLIVTYEAMRREKFHTTTTNYIRCHFALIIFSFLIGAIGFLVVESPFNRLCDMLEGKSSATSQRKATSGNNLAVAPSSESVCNNKEKNM